MSEDAPELTAELVMGGVVPSQPVISPGGCRVAYVVAPADPQDRASNVRDMAGRRWTVAPRRPGTHDPSQRGSTKMMRLHSSRAADQRELRREQALALDVARLEGPADLQS